MAWSKKNYRLAFFKHYNNLQYRVDVIIMVDVPDIKKYICDNLNTKNMEMDTASVIDHNRNLVRLVCSDKAGMGKECGAIQFITIEHNCFI